MTADIASLIVRRSVLLLNLQGQNLYNLCPGTDWPGIFMQRIDWERQVCYNTLDSFKVFTRKSKVTGYQSVS